MKRLSAEFTGVVSRINERGVLLEGETEWQNISKWAAQIDAAEPGDAVLLRTDKSGFVRELRVAGGSAEAPREPQGGPSAQGAAAAPQRPAAGAFAAHMAQEARSETEARRNRTITRLAVLKAAAEYASSRERYEPEDVLRIAGYWESWIGREDEAGDAAG